MRSPKNLADGPDEDQCVFCDESPKQDLDNPQLKREPALIEDSIEIRCDHLLDELTHERVWIAQGRLLILELPIFAQLRDPVFEEEKVQGNPKARLLNMCLSPPWAL